MNKTAGFWIRFFTRLLDSIVVFALSGIFLYLIVDIENNVIKSFKLDILFYFWILFFIFLLITIFILIPYFLNGQTLFMKLFKIKIEFELKNKLFSLIIRELFFSISWIFMSLLLAIMINHTLILKFASTSFSRLNFTNFEIFRIYVIRSFGGIITLIQFCFLVSIIVKQDKIGLHDIQSKTRVVWINKFFEKIQEEKPVRIKPTIIKNNPVIWINKKEKK